MGVDVFEMIVLVVAVSCFAGVVNNWIKTRGKVSAKDLDREFDKRLGEVDELRRRVEVLEKIVTDRSYSVKEELRRL